MKFLSSILNSFQKEITSHSIDNNECPNCWGRQEYGGEEYEAVRNHQGASLENQSRKGWIQAYVERFLIVSKKKQGIETVCAKCKLSYHQKK